MSVEDEARGEVEALQAIHGAACAVRQPWPPHVEVLLLPLTGEDASCQFVQAWLTVKASEQYPEARPELGLRAVKGLGDDRQRSLLGSLRDWMAAQPRGALLVALLEEAREQLSCRNEPEGECCFCRLSLAPSPSPSPFPSLSQAEALLKLPSCFHAFHRECFAQWWRWEVFHQKEAKQPIGSRKAGGSAEVGPTLRCPICRVVIGPSDVAHVSHYLESADYEPAAALSDEARRVPLELLSPAEQQRRALFAAQLEAQKVRGALVPARRKVVLPGVHVARPHRLEPEEADPSEGSEEGLRKRETSEGRFCSVNTAASPSDCPGTEAETAGRAAACEGCPNQQICATAPKGPDPDVAVVEERMRGVKHKILVLSGKGGVGKSTFSAQMSFALAAQDKQVGLLDIDICGPSIPKMLGLEGEEVHQSAAGWSPVYVTEGLGVMSVGFLLASADEAVVWRGPRKNALIKQFLRDVDWGELDYLIVDAPPGTSDEHISVVQYLQAGHVDGAVIVTTPQEVSIIDVRKEINFCKKVGLRVLGVVENMSGLQLPLSALHFAKVGPTGEERDVTEEVLEELKKVAPHLLNGITAKSEIFYQSGGGAEAMARQFGVPFLGRIPMDPSLSRAAEEGRSCFPSKEDLSSPSPSVAALQRIISQVVSKVEGRKGA